MLTEPSALCVRDSLFIVSFLLDVIGDGPESLSQVRKHFGPAMSFLNENNSRRVKNWQNKSSFCLIYTHILAWPLADLLPSLS